MRYVAGSISSLAAAHNGANALALCAAKITARHINCA